MKFRVRKHFVFQSVLVFACVSLVLLLYELFGGIIVASLGASGFILFVTPHTQSSRAKNIIGGYICGASMGVLFSLLHGFILSVGFTGTDLTIVFVCAAAAASTTFLMVSANLVHPPSAALALGLAADAQSVKTALAALVGITILCAVRYLLRKYIKDLI